MTVKSIFQVDVEDSAFKEFLATFDKYKEALDRSLGQWGKVNAAVRNLDAGNKAAASGLTTQNTLMQQLDRSAQHVGVAVTTQAHAWRQMARNAGTFAHHITDATRSLLRWTALTGLVSGILGAGGLFGIERLAAVAGGGRRASMGLGTDYGALRAFGVNYGRVVDSSAFLGNVNEALHDVTKRSALYGAGLTENDIHGKDTATVASQLLPALKRLADQTPDQMLGQVLHARGLDQFISLQEFQRLKTTPASELAGYGRDFERDRKALNLDDGQQRAWQSLQVQLTRAGELIETTFIRELTPLAPQIEHLSASFANLVKALLGSDTVRDGIESMATGLEWFSKKVDTPEFRADTEAFIAGVGSIAKALISAGKTIAGWLSPSEPPNPGEPPKPETKPAEGGWALGWRPDGTFGLRRDEGMDAPAPATKPADKGAPPPNNDNVDPWTNGLRHSRYLGGQTAVPFIEHAAFRTGGGFTQGSASFAALERENGLPDGMLDAVWNTESGRGKNMGPSRSGAMGHFQFLPSTARAYGVADPNDLQQASAGAAHLLRDLLRQFGGDPEKAAAAYNWGSGNLSRDLREHGDRWRDYLPEETRRYIAKVVPQSARTMRAPLRDQNAARVDINNNTGGNVHVSQLQTA